MSTSQDHRTTSSSQVYDTRNVIHLGLTALLFWLAIYFDIVPHAFATEPGFSYMSQLGSEHSWSVLFLVAANVGVIGLLAASAPVRLASVLLVATAHGIFAGCLIMSFPSAWTGTYAIIAAMGYYVAYRFAIAVG